MLPPRLLLASLALTSLAATAEPDSYRLGTQRFIAEIAETHGFDASALEALLAQARYRQSIIDAMNQPYEAKPWRDYRKLFLTPERIRGGADFWRANAATLQRAEASFGVQPEIIVAIIGVETSYGANVGRYPVLDALTTLGFSYPKRADFFRSQLTELLELAREEQIKPAELRGSYVGAMGLPQFIPSSYRAYAVDFDADGQRDLWRSNADVIGSVANYFKQHGWRPDGSVAFRAQVTTAHLQGLEIAEKRPIAPKLTLEALQESGVSWEPNLLDSATPASLIRLDGPEEEYWIGLENFYVITRYNHSNLYAMAVHQLSEAIRAAFAEAG
ncbi:lytic murein transglycosylase B [Thiorhodococcus mannitoliphagus]|uniref:Lytic murein transglycosylase B n=1 Tax=Thiorhodococcus mannitoliphagus TaxID=329406 RepID=A0A6P1DSF2_9GAMM|nr:lytic murein transglycosylase B [Thiorhodococcus mannitoliphagus]NEX20480.1 lytic murein transglycosylase B [Thiorhodococcus mannitoliphagus]